MSHDADLTRVTDAHGYHAGWACTCSCGWTSDLCDRQPEAIHDLADHLGMTRPQPKDGTG